MMSDDQFSSGITSQFPELTLTGKRRLSAELVRVIRGFPKPHDPYLLLARSDTTWRRLLESDPVLALIVARGKEFGSINPCPFVMMGGPERMCAFAGFPGNERTVRLLQVFDLHADHAIPDLLVLRGLLVSEPWAFDVLEAKPRIAVADLNHLALGLETFEHWGDRNALEWFFCLPTAIRHFIGRLYADAGEQNSEAACPVKPLSDFRSKEEAIAWLRNYSKPSVPPPRRSHRRAIVEEL